MSPPDEDVPVAADVFPRGRGVALPPAGVLGAVFVGGFLGGLARYLVTGADVGLVPAFPWALVVVNTAGSFGLALLLALLAEAPAGRYVRPLLGTGLLGAFTTFSTVTVAVDRLLANGSPGLAAAVLGVGLLAGLAGAVLGLLLGRAVVVRHR